MSTVSCWVKKKPVPAACGVALMATVAWIATGCGLGFIEISPGQAVGLSVQNGTANTVKIQVTVAASLSDAGLNGAGSTIPSVDTEVLVTGGNSTTGVIPCGNAVTVTATVPDNFSTIIELSGDGTGTPGFDSGSVGPTGERFLLLDTHFACGDTISVLVDSTDAGRVVVVNAGDAVPDLGGVPDDGGATGGGDLDTPSADSAKVTFRLENATPSPVDITIGVSSSGEDDADQPPVRVPGGEFSQGELDCGDDFLVSAAIVDTDGSVVTLTGDGTGTAGFDGASVGQNGERLIQFVAHYECGGTAVVRITDDGSGIGLSTSEGAAGTVEVFSPTETVPPPVLPDPEDFNAVQTAGEITLVVANAVESTIQVNFATGSGTLASSGGVDISSEFDVRVPPGATTVGTGLCAQELIIAAAHLEATASTFSAGGTDIFEGGGNVNFHGVSLTGDGTGTENFDSNSIAVSRGRLFQQGVHFDCGDTITVMVTATNNQFQQDADGLTVLDDFGNPTIQYNVGSGEVRVTVP